MQDELSTAVVEMEAIINARPLSYISTEDVEEPLTPSHLLCGHSAAPGFTLGHGFPLIPAKLVSNIQRWE